MPYEPQVYVVYVSRRTRRRLDKAANLEPRPGDPSHRLSQILGESLEQVLPPGTGWTLWQSTSVIDTDDKYFQIDFPEGAPLVKAPVRTLFDDRPLEYGLLRPIYSAQD